MKPGFANYIQSLYVAEGKLSDESVADANNRINRAMEQIVELAQLPENIKQHAAVNRSTD